MHASAGATDFFPPIALVVRTDATWGGHVEIDALKRVYGLEFTIFRELPTVGVDPQFAPPVEEDALAEVRCLLDLATCRRSLL